MNIPKKQSFKSINNPVTFHSKIKSNNYGKIEPKREMFKSKLSNRSNSVQKKTNPTNISLPLWHEASGDIQILETKYCIGLNEKIPILCSDVSREGYKYVVGHSDGKI